MLKLKYELGEFGSEVKFAPSRSVSAHALSDRLLNQITTLVYHTTGPGPIKRVKQLSPLNSGECAAWIYQHIMDFSGHFVIGLEGEVVQTVPLNLVAEHVGSTCFKDGVFAGRASVLYNTANFRTMVPGWWRLVMNDHGLWQRFYDLINIDGTYNKHTIGIEFVTGPKAKGLLTEKQIEASKSLEQFLKQKVPTLSWATSHTILNPISRTKGKVRYDLYQNQSEQLFDGREWKAL